MKEPGSPRSSIIAAFRQHDEAGTKLISRSSLLHVVGSLQLDVSPAQLDTLLEASGSPADADVNYEDFIAWLCGDKEELPAAAPAEVQYVEDFFPHLFGFEEVSSGYSEVQEQFLLEKESTILVSKSNGRRFCIGSFEYPSLSSLRKEERQLAGWSSASDPPLLVRHIITTGALEDHAEKANRGTLFQVASQFNCLEFTSNARVPEEGVSWYVHDSTQGPACAVACAPATVYRNYLLPLGEQRGQTETHQLNLLDELEQKLGNREKLGEDGRGRFFWLRNGYVCSDPSRLAALRKHLEEIGEDGREELRASIKVGLGIGCEVVFSALVPFEGLLPMPVQGEKQTVSQVFCAAADVRGGGCTAEDWEPFARLLLEATYEAALWSCVRNARLVAGGQSPPPKGSRRVVLTSVGGGVFGNLQEWILDAINRALRLLREAPECSRGLEVCVAHFQSLNPSLVEGVPASET